MTRLYYTPPTDRQFEEIRTQAIKIWKSYDNTYGYATSKIDSIKDIQNIEDNFMYMVAMFDLKNQTKLAFSLSSETRLAVRERMIDGGQPKEYIPF